MRPPQPSHLSRKGQGPDLGSRNALHISIRGAWPSLASFSRSISASWPYYQLRFCVPRLTKGGAPLWHSWLSGPAPSSSLSTGSPSTPAESSASRLGCQRPWSTSTSNRCVLSGLHRPTSAPKGTPFISSTLAPWLTYSRTCITSTDRVITAQSQPGPCHHLQLPGRLTHRNCIHLSWSCCCY